MILLDTNVLIYASTNQSPFLEWARRTIATGVSEDGAAVNAVTVLARPGGGVLSREAGEDRGGGVFRLGAPTLYR